MFRAIFAQDQFGVIGNNGKLPWPPHRDDIGRFRYRTMGSTIIMGRKTADSLARPLDGRRNLVLTRNHHYQRDGFETIHHLGGLDSDIWIIGGAEILRATELFWSEFHMTIFEARIEGDTYFLPDMKFWKLAHTEIFTGEPINATYLHYKRVGYK